MADILNNITQSGASSVSTELRDGLKAESGVLGDNEFNEFSQALKGQVEGLDPEAEENSLETGLVSELSAEQLVGLLGEDSQALDESEGLTSTFSTDPQIDQILPLTGKDMPVENLDPTQISAAAVVAPNLETAKKLDLDSVRGAKGLESTSGRWFSLLNQSADSGSKAPISASTIYGNGSSAELGVAASGGLQQSADISSLAQLAANGTGQTNIDLNQISNSQNAVTQVQTSVTIAQDQSGARQVITEQTIEIPVGKSGWGQELGSKVVWMVGQKIQTAQIQVTPRELGPIEIRISVQQDQATVNFTAQNGQAREAIESALPRLREMFDQSGLQLAHTDVSDQQTARHDEQATNASGQDGERRLADAAEEAQLAVSASTSINGLVDYYA